MGQHHHHHQHDHGDNLGLAFFLNLGFAVIELVGGVLTNSVAILSDAVHDLGDSLSIGLAWFLARLGRRRPNDRFSYGFRRFSLLGALINSVVLIAGSVIILVEAVPRLWAPEMPHAPGMLGLAVLGVSVNGLAAWRLRGGQSLNARVISWHLLEDVLGWVAVLVVALVLLFRQWPILDPLLSIGFTLFILFNVGRALAETVGLFLQQTPRDVEMQQIVVELERLPHVENAHHVHLWSLDGEHHVLTAHLRMSEGTGLVEMRETRRALDEAVAGWEISHTTVELELPGEACRIDGEGEAVAGGG